MSDQRKTPASRRGAASRTHPDDACASFKRSFPERFSVRLHMTLLLFGVFFSGFLFSKVLFELGLRSMLARYVIAVCASYAVFFLLIKIWLWFVTRPPKSESSLTDIDIGNAGDIAADALQGGFRGAHKAAEGALSGHGSDFGGGGATDMWGPSITPKTIAPSTASGGSGSRAGSGVGGFDLGDEGVVLIVLAALALTILSAGAYLIWAAPGILSEAAFQALLAAGLIKASNKITQRGWMGSVLRSTCVPFLIVLLMTGIFGWVAHKHYPHATRLADIFKPANTERR